MASKRNLVRHYPAIYPVLVAVLAVLGPYSTNIRYVRLGDIFPILLVVTVIAVAILAFVLMLLRDTDRSAIVAGALVAYLMWYGYAVAVLRPFVAADIVAVVIPGVLVGGGLLVAFRSGRFLRPISFSLTVVLSCLLVVQTLSIAPYHLGPSATTRIPHISAAGLRNTQRDIFYLVFDRYGSADALIAAHGIEDNDLPSWLSERGFDVAWKAHSNYVRTSLSLASVLNVDYVQELSDVDPASSDLRPLEELLGDHAVGRFLQQQGYRYVHVGSWADFLRTARSADENRVPEAPSLFQLLIMQRSALPVLTQLVPSLGLILSGDELHAMTARLQFRTLGELLDEPGPTLVFAHVLLPHDPYVFDEAGNFVSAPDRAQSSDADLFAGQLKYTNREIRKLVEKLLARPVEDQPIMIIQADEGPFPARYGADPANFDWNTATETELQAKYGILSAFYLPGEPHEGASSPEIYPTMSSVNTFRLVLSRYFGADLPLLPDRSYTSRSPLLVYDFTDITERLPWPGP